MDYDAKKLNLHQKKCQVVELQRSDVSQIPMCSVCPQTTPVPTLVTSAGGFSCTSPLSTRTMSLESHRSKLVHFLWLP